MSDLSSQGSISPDVRRIVDTVMQHVNVPRKRQKFLNFVKNILRGVRPAAIEATWDIFEQALKKPQEESDKPKEEESGQKDENHTKAENGTKNDDEAESREEAVESRLGVSMFQGIGSIKDNSEPAERKKKKKSKQNGAEDTKENDAINGKKSKKRKREEEEEEETATDSPETPKKVKLEKFVWEDVISQLLSKKGGEMKVAKLKKKVIAEYMNVHESTHKTQEELSAKLEKKIHKNKMFKVLKDVVKLNQ